MSKYTYKQYKRDRKTIGDHTSKSTEKRFHTALKRNKKAKAALTEYLQDRKKRGYSKKTFDKFLRKDRLKQGGNRRVAGVAKKAISEYLNEYDKIEKADKAEALAQKKAEAAERKERIAAKRQARRDLKEKMRLKREFGAGGLGNTGVRGLNDAAPREGLSENPREMYAQDINKSSMGSRPSALSPTKSNWQSKRDFRPRF